MKTGEETKKIELIKYNKTQFSRKIYGITANDKNNNLNNNVIFFDNYLENTFRSKTIKKYIVDTNCNRWFYNKLRRIKRKKLICIKQQS